MTDGVFQIVETTCIVLCTNKNKIKFQSLNIYFPKKFEWPAKRKVNLSYWNINFWN
jgi:hypothetical protein